MQYDKNPWRMGRMIDKIGDTTDKGSENRRICVYNFSKMSIKDLQDFFGADTIEGITLFEYMAFVQFKRASGHTEALLKNMSTCKGRKIIIKPYKTYWPSLKSKDIAIDRQPKRESSPIRSRRHHSLRSPPRSRERDEIRRTSHRSTRSSRERSRSDDRRRESYSRIHDTREDTKSTSIVPISQSKKELKMSSDDIWGIKPCPTSDSFVKMTQSSSTSNLQRIFSDNQQTNSVQQHQQPQQQQPAQTQTVKQYQIQANTLTQSHLTFLSEPMTITAPPIDALALPPRIKLLMDLMILHKSASAVSIDQIREMEQFLASVRQEMEVQQQSSNIVTVETKQSQNGNSNSDDSGLHKTKDTDVSDEALEIANKFRSYQR